MPKLTKAKILKSANATKPVASKRSLSFTSNIKVLEDCIASDQTKLVKEYPKALAAVEKSLNIAKKELKRAKVANQKNAKNKKSTTSLIDTRTLMEKVKGLEAEKKTLKLASKQFKEQQNSLAKLTETRAKLQKKAMKKPAKTEGRKIIKDTATANTNNMPTQGLTGNSL